ncbi:MAG: YcxB family protein [Anaerolineales bacterium]
MVIEYQIKRFDLVKTYFYNLGHSRRTQLAVFGLDALVILISLYRSYHNHGNLVFYDWAVAIMMGIGFILAVPALSFLTAKTQKRTLSINQEGIETKIGSQQGKIAWKAVDSVVATKDRILITGKSANVFTIPSGAFASDDLRNQFIELVTQYHANAQ